MAAVGGACASGQRRAAQVGFTHQPSTLRPMQRRGRAARHARRAVGPLLSWIRRMSSSSTRLAAPAGSPAAAPGMVAAGRQPQRVAHHPNRPDAAMLIDERTSSGGRSEDERGFLGCRAPSAARSRAEAGRSRGQVRRRQGGACVVERLAAPVACAPNCIIHRQAPSRADQLPGHRAHRQAVHSHPVEAALNVSGNTRRAPLI